MKILIGADIVPTSNNLSFFCDGSVNDIVDKGIIRVMNAYDYRVCNLETPLCDKETPIDKCGANHITPTSVAKRLREFPIDLCALANNHIMDQGTEGLLSTMKTLKENNVGYCGVGNNLNEARKIFTFRLNDEAVGVFNCAEHEFSIAGEDTSGACPYDPLYVFDYVSDKKQDVDYLIVLYHGGKEYYQYPSPQLQRTCRRFVEKGADLVICQHSHCIGCEEKYGNGTIVYGQGNFIFYDESNQLGKNSILIGVDTLDNTILYYPITYSEKVSLSDDDEAKKVLSEFTKRSNRATDSDFLKSEYERFAIDKSWDYFRSLMGKPGRGFLYRVANKLTRGKFNKYMIKRRYDKNSILTVLNYVKCEAHNELIIKGLEEHSETVGK